MLRFALGLALFGLAFLASPHPAEAQTILGPELAGNKLCVLDVSQGTTWAPYGTGDMKDATSTAFTAAACPSNWYLTSCTVLNTHATQTLYAAAASITGAGPAVTNRPMIPAQQALRMPLYGVYQKTIAVRGSGAATTGQIQCYAVPR